MRVLVGLLLAIGAALGAVVFICDAFGRTILAPADLPVGVITALLGGPGFIWMIRSQHASNV